MSDGEFLCDGSVVVERVFGGVGWCQRRVNDGEVLDQTLVSLTRFFDVFGGSGGGIVE